MENSEYRKRIIDERVELYLKTFGAICIEGPKWCGKTWTARFHSNSEILIGNPTNGFQNRELAQLSALLVLDGERPRLIDEWQEVPEIWDAVRYKVDEKPLKGQFILTGSSTPRTKGILHSGAGRIAKLRMRPMSLYESGDSSGDVSLFDLMNGTINAKMTGDVSLKNLANLIIRGGWPGSIGLPIEGASLLPTEYIKLVVDDDIGKLDGKNFRKDKLELLLRSLARNESTTVSNNTLKKDIKDIDDEDVDLNTIATYLEAFDRLFLTDSQLPFNPGMRSSMRVKQSVKRHFSDPSLAAALLKATSQSLINDLATFGFLFEALCERDLKIYAESFGANLFHYQDYNNNEIDAVIEMPDGSWGAFEIKLGANQIDKAAANLLKLQNKMAKDPKGKPPVVLCVITGLSSAAYQRPDGVFVVPITSLKN